MKSRLAESMNPAGACADGNPSTQARGIAVRLDFFFPHGKRLPVHQPRGIARVSLEHGRGELPVPRRGSAL
jgi:hypothetical protein